MTRRRTIARPITPKRRFQFMSDIINYKVHPNDREGGSVAFLGKPYSPENLIKWKAPFILTFDPSW
jgi:hypothetical protein